VYSQSRRFNLLDILVIPFSVDVTKRTTEAAAHIPGGRHDILSASFQSAVTNSDLGIGGEELSLFKRPVGNICLISTRNRSHIISLAHATQEAIVLSLYIRELRLHVTVFANYIKLLLDSLHGRRARTYLRGSFS
jgi:hypothetical protein